MPRPTLPIGSWGSINSGQVPSGRWRSRTRYRGDDGRIRQVEAWGASRAASERALRANLATRTESTGTVITSETTLGELAAYWLRTAVERSDLAANTRKRYADLVKKRITPDIGGLRVREASVARMANYILDVAADSPSTANLCRSILVGMFTLAVHHGAKSSNPMREIKAVKTPPKEVRALSPQETTDLRRTLRGDKQAVRADLVDLVDLMLATGCRLGEALALRWSDLDLVAGTATLSGTVIRDSKLGLIRQDKTKGGKPRAMRLPAAMVTMLLKRSIDGLPGGPIDLVFPTANLTPREVSTVERQWRDFRSRHPEWQWVTTHVFRKTVGTAVERASGVETAAKVLGHSSPTTTDRHYVERPDVGPDVSGVLAAFVAPLDESAG